MPANLEDSDDDSVYELPLDDAIEIFEQEANGMDVDASDDEDDDSDLEDVPDASIAHFASHSSSKRQPIYCLAAHPRTSAIAASGGQDDMAYIWDTATGQEIVKLTGHTDSVVAVQFSSDGELIATGGMDGKVRLWRRVKPTRVLNEVSEWSQWEFLTNLEGPDEVTTLAWHPKGPVLAAGARDGTVWMWNLPSGKTMSIFSGHTSSIQALAWVSPIDGKRLLSASESSEIYLWDPKETYSAPVVKFQGSVDPRLQFEGGITSVVVNTAGTVALVGGAENAALRLINLTSGQFVKALGPAHQARSSIEALVWLDLSAAAGIWISGASDGSICAWESAAGGLRWKAEHPQPAAPEPEPDAQAAPAEGQDAEMRVDKEAEEEAAMAREERIAISCISLFPSKTGLVSSGADGSLRSWDARSGMLLAEHPGHSRAIHAVAVTPDSGLILSAGDNGLVRVHKAQQ